MPTSVTEPIYDSDTDEIRWIDVPQPRERPTALEIETAAAAAAAGLAAGAAARDAAEQQGAGVDAQDGEFDPPEQLSDYESDSDGSSGAGEPPDGSDASDADSGGEQQPAGRVFAPAARPLEILTCFDDWPYYPLVDLSADKRSAVWIINWRLRSLRQRRWRVAFLTVQLTSFAGDAQPTLLGR